MEHVTENGNLFYVFVLFHTYVCCSRCCCCYCWCRSDSLLHFYAFHFTENLPLLLGQCKYGSMYKHSIHIHNMDVNVDVSHACPWIPFDCLRVRIITFFLLAFEFALLCFVFFYYFFSVCYPMCHPKKKLAGSHLVRAKVARPSNIGGYFCESFVIRAKCDYIKKCKARNLYGPNARTHM